MSISYTLKSAGKAFLLSLLLMCLSMHSGVATVIYVTGSYNYNNPSLCGCSYFKFDVTGDNRVNVNISHMTKNDGSFVSLLLNQNRSSSYPPLTIAVTDFTMVNSMNCLFHPTAPNTMINYTRGTFKGFHDVYGAQHLQMAPIVSPGFTLYISDVTSTFVGNAYGTAILLSMININNFTGNGLNPKTGMYIFRVTTNNANSFIQRSSPVQRKKITGVMQHIGTISVTDSKCVNCKESFYYDFSTNIIEHGLVRFQDCRHTGPGAFYTPVKSIFGKPSLQIQTNGNLILSNVTTNGPLFGYVAKNDGGITSTSRLTLHQIKAASLYPGEIKYKLFASVPDGAQIYLGPMNFAGQDVSTLSEYNALMISFTRVTDANRKVRFVASGRARADVGDSSQVDEFSASHCVNDGYSSVGSVKVSFNSDDYEAKCICNSDRFVPHCTTTWDPLGESLCPVGMTMSLTQRKCVSCSLPHCSRCDVADQCAECDKDYLPVEGTHECAFHLDHCKVVSVQNRSKCAECDAGFSLTINGKCVATIPNCVSYNDDGFCLSCDSGLSPSADGKVCVSCLLENCAQCDSNGECSYCKDNYTLVDGKCIECFIEGCVECYKPNLCGLCDLEVGGCVIGGEQDTSKGIPWWVWLIVGLAAAVVVGLIIFFIVWCCCCGQQEYFVTYQERYNEDEEKNGDRDMRLWDRNGDISGDEHGAMFMMNDNVRPRIFKQDENTTHGDGSSFATSDSSSSTSSSRENSSTSSGSSTDSERNK